MDWKTFNDLVGVDKAWGKYDDLLPWQLVIYNRAKNMWSRCYRPQHPGYSTYGGAGIKVDFISLSQYYKCLKKDPLWSDLVKHPELYEIDKDTKCGHGVNYGPSTIKIVLKSENNREMLHRTSLCGMKKAYEARARWCVCEGILFKSMSDVARHFGIPSQTASKRLRSSDPRWSGWFYL